MSYCATCATFDSACSNSRLAAYPTTSSTTFPIAPIM